MYGLILAIHVASAGLTVIGTLATLAGAMVRKGSLQVSRWGLLLASVSTVFTGAVLVLLTGQGLGRVCVLGFAVVASAWGAYVFLRQRMPAPTSVVSR